MIHVGITGTQKGGTERQLASLNSLLFDLMAGESWLHHGDCLGVDAESHQAGRRLGWKIRVHPPTNPSKRAFCVGDGMDAERSYLDRNKVIVNSSKTGLIVVPKEVHQVLRSGTWSTARYAGKLQRPTWVIPPDGAVIFLPEGIGPE